jgi:2-(1,2-epoxy-1,2-dihydrophenyl)acetyl-CoA isomerase
MNDRHVQVEVRDDVAVVTIDRPKVKNAISVETVDQLHVALDSVESHARALVLAGAEGNFCSGADVGTIRDAMDGVPADVLGPMIDAVNHFILRLRRLPKPVIAAVDGVAVGAGLGFAFAADLRVVSNNALFIGGQLALGLSPDAGVSYFLSQALGPARAHALMLRNTRITAADLAAWGLVEEIVAGPCVEAAIALAGQVAGTAPLALVRLRALSEAATTHTLAEHLAAERAAIVPLWETADFREGVAAFFERRSPKFDGS